MKDNFCFVFYKKTIASAIYLSSCEKYENLYKPKFVEFLNNFFIWHRIQFCRKKMIIIFLILHSQTTKKIQKRSDVMELISKYLREGFTYSGFREYNSQSKILSQFTARITAFTLLAFPITMEDHVDR